MENIQQENLLGNLTRLTLTGEQLLNRPHLVRGLLDKTANDPLVQKNTSDGKGTGRFSSLEALQNDILNTDRTYYFLMDGFEIVGVIWIENLHINRDVYNVDHVMYENYSASFAIRVYAPLQGKGQAGLFMREIMEIVDFSNIWLSVHLDNPGAIKLYKNNGFVEVQDNVERNCKLMIFKGLSDND